MVRMGIFTSKCKSKLGSQYGQSIIEYILLLAVVGTLLNVVLGSKLVKDLFGPDSSFFAALSNYTETTYQFGHFTRTRNEDYTRGGVHDLYAQDAGTSHFWAPTTGDQ